MAGVPTFEVLQSFRAALASIMPGTVPVFYAHPGDQFLGAEAVWFDQIVDDYSVHSMKADRRRRKIRTGFDVVVQVFQVGATDPTVENTQQYLCDTRAAIIVQAIDEYVADEQHLSRPDLVDVGWLGAGARTERGLTDQGCGTRVTLRVEYDARIL